MEQQQKEQSAISIKNLYVSYDKHQALADICLDVKQNEFIGIIGPNGGGKSTLLKTILGFLPIQSGAIDIFGTAAKKSKERIGYVPQISPVDRKFPICVLDVVLSGVLKGGLHPFYRFSQENKDLAMQKLKLLDIDGLAKKQVSELSGGEFQRLLTARALAVEPRILLLDEPTANVDAVSRNKIFDLLGELNKNMTILLVTHDLMAISSSVKSLACLNKTLVYHGETELDNEVLTHLYGCPVDLIAHGVPHRVLNEHCHHNKEDS